ncbi:MAG: hypothetical protein ACRCZF_13830 [Gemmataceae bacterium]
MATPWEQAEEFVRLHWRGLKTLTKGRRPTRPLNVLEQIGRGWAGPALNQCDCPAWVFMYLPKGNGLYEWADNVAPARDERNLLGWAKLKSVMGDGGMVFLALLRNERLTVPAVALVRLQRLYVFDQPDGVHPPLSEAGWERYVHG